MQQPARRWSGRWALPLAVFILLTGLHMGVMSQTAAPAGAPLAPALDAARARLRDAETLTALSSEGQLLYQRKRIKLDGYQYCSRAVAQAERGDFRDSIRSASKALHVGRMQANDDLVALSKRDLAIAYSHAGDLDAAERDAREALGHHARDESLVAGPAYKTLGDVAARRGDLAPAIDLYGQAQVAPNARSGRLCETVRSGCTISMNCEAAVYCPGLRSERGRIPAISSQPAPGYAGRGVQAVTERVTERS